MNLKTIFTALAITTLVATSTAPTYADSDVFISEEARPQWLKDFDAWSEKEAGPVLTRFMCYLSLLCVARDLKDFKPLEGKKLF